MNGEAMKRSLLSLTTALLVVATAWGQEKKLDFNNLTPEQIEEFKAMRHSFYAEETRGEQKVIREQLLRMTTKLDGNQADYDVRYYGIDVNLNFTTGTIISRVDCKIKSLVSGLNAVDLNLHSQLIVDSVKVNGVTASFSRPGNLLAITTPSSIPLNQEFDMKVFYHGTPYYAFQQGMELPTSGVMRCAGRTASHSVRTTGGHARTGQRTSLSHLTFMWNVRPTTTLPPTAR